MARLLWLCLFAMIRDIRRGMLIRSNLFRSLVISRLLATGGRGRALPLAFLRRTRSTLPLTLFNRLPVLSQNGPFDRAGAFDLFRNWGLANNIANRLGSERSAGRSRNYVHLWSFVNDDSTA